MNNYIHEVSVTLSKKLLGNGYKDDRLRSAKVAYAIENIIEDVKAYVVVFLLFGTGWKAD